MLAHCTLALPRLCSLGDVSQSQQITGLLAASPCWLCQQQLLLNPKAGVSFSPGVSVTSSNTGVPDISGSVYSKTQVGACRAPLCRGAQALPPWVRRGLPLEPLDREKGNAWLSLT